MKHSALITGTLLLGTLTFAFANDKGNASDAGFSAFKGNCISCHGPGGAGTPLGKSIHAPDLRSDEVQKKPDSELAQTITEGKGICRPSSGFSILDRCRLSLPMFANSARVVTDHNICQTFSWKITFSLL